jgi:hypothetical protein
VLINEAGKQGTPFGTYTIPMVAPILCQSGHRRSGNRSSSVSGTAARIRIETYKTGGGEREGVRQAQKNVCGEGSCLRPGALLNKICWLVPAGRGRKGNTLSGGIETKNRNRKSTRLGRETRNQSLLASGMGCGEDMQRETEEEAATIRIGGGGALSAHHPKVFFVA